VLEVAGQTMLEEPFHQFAESFVFQTPEPPLPPGPQVRGAAVAAVASASVGARRVKMRRVMMASIYGRLSS